MLYTVDLQIALQDLEGIAQCCPRLTSLNISSCRSLHPAALSILLPELDQQQRVCEEQGPDSSCALPQLTSLDVSYCSLPAGMVCRLLQHGYRFQVIWIYTSCLLSVTVTIPCFAWKLQSG